MFTRFKAISRYRKIEIVFFMLIFFLFPILTDIEYRINEAPCEQCDYRFTTALLIRLVGGFFTIWPWIFFYRFVINGLLIQKKYRYFIIATILYFLALELYTLYGFYWTASKMEFLPDSITASYKRYFSSKSFLHFSLIYVISEMFVFMALAFYINSQKQEQRLTAIKKQKLELDLKYLKAQMEPHFFFNTLNNVYSLALQGSKETAPLVARLSDLMRYILYESNKEFVSVEGEIDFIRSYIAVQSVRFNDKINVSFNVEPVSPGYLIQPLLLLPFFENAFKHGVEDETHNGFVHSTICLESNRLHLNLCNSIVRNKSLSNLKTGIGLSNTQKRLDLVYPGKHQLITTIQDHQFSVNLILSLEN